ncbi:MAG: hypothetical protein ACNA7Z_04775 [Dethiobacteria bacterium]
MNCTNCGLLDKQVSPNYCLRFKKVIEDFSVGQDCIYFFKEQFEEDELLTPQQHLLLQNQDQRSKKMQGPMR